MRKNIQNQKLLLLNIIPIILSIFSALAVGLTVRKVSELAQQSKAEEVIIEEINNLIYGLSRMARNVRGQIIFPEDKSYLQSYNDGLLLFENSYSNLDNLITDKEQQQRLNNIIAEGKKHDQLAQKIFQLLQTNQIDEAKKQIPLIRFKNIDDNYNLFLYQQKSILSDHSQTLTSTLAYLNYFIIGNTILGLILATILGLLIWDNLRKTQKLEQQAEKLIANNQQLQKTQAELSNNIEDLKNTQTQLIQSEKMSSLGQLVAGIAHEINNPVNFIYGNITPAQQYIHDLIGLIALYQEYYPEPSDVIKDRIDEIELSFVSEDILNLLNSMKIGADRIRKIVLTLRNFSRMDEAEYKAVDIHEGIDSTLLILHNRFKSEIEVVKKYGNLPLVECYPAQLNQVFMNLINNAIDALQSQSEKGKKQIIIQTETIGHAQVKISFIDNGPGIPPDVYPKLFDPFFTTKPIGEGTGLGLAICYKIIEKHQGTIVVDPNYHNGTQFDVIVPITINTIIQS